MVTPDGNNILSGLTSFPATPVQHVTESSTIVCDGTRVAVASETPTTLSAAPAIAPGIRDGQICMVHNAGGHAITLTSAAGSNLKLEGGGLKLEPAQPVLLIWDEGSRLWTQPVGGGTTKASAQVLNTAPQCHDTPGALTSVTIPRLSTGQTAIATVHIGKSGTDPMSFRLLAGGVSGTELAGLALGAAVSGSMEVEITQFDSATAASRALAVSTESTLTGKSGELSRNTGEPLVLTVIQSDCRTDGNAARVKALSVRMVEAP